MRTKARHALSGALMGSAEVIPGGARSRSSSASTDGTLLAPPDEASAVLPPLLMALCGIAVVAALLRAERNRSDETAPG